MAFEEMNLGGTKIKAWLCAILAATVSAGNVRADVGCRAGESDLACVARLDCERQSFFTCKEFTDACADESERMFALLTVSNLWQIGVLEDPVFLNLENPNKACQCKGGYRGFIELTGKDRDNEVQRCISMVMKEKLKKER